MFTCTEAGPSMDSGRVVHVLRRTIIWPLDVSRELFMDGEILTPSGNWIISRTVAMIYLRKGGSTNQSSFLISFHKLIAVSCFFKIHYEFEIKSKYNILCLR